MTAGLGCPLSPSQVVDEYFIENRTRILELAAFLDRLDRAASHTSDYRVRALDEAISILADTSRGKLTRIQELLSDPASAPLSALDRKSAVGAFNRWEGHS